MEPSFAAVAFRADDLGEEELDNDGGLPHDGRVANE